MLYLMYVSHFVDSFTGRHFSHFYINDIMNIVVKIWGIFSNSLGIYVKVELLGNIVILFQIFWRTAIPFLHSDHNTLHLHQKRICVLNPVCVLVMLIIFCFLDNRYCIDMKWYHIMILIWICLMIRVVENLCICLWDICKSYLEKYLSE